MPPARPRGVRAWLLRAWLLRAWLLRAWLSVIAYAPGPSPVRAGADGNNPRIQVDRIRST